MHSILYRTSGVVHLVHASLRHNNYCSYVLLVFFSFFEKIYLLLSYATSVRLFARLSVCPSVCLSVCVNIFFAVLWYRAADWSQNRPECPLGGGACPKGVIFRNSNCKLQIYAICNFFANRFVCTVLTDLLTRFCWKLICMYVLRWCMSERVDF